MELQPLLDSAKLSGVQWGAQARLDFTARRWIEVGRMNTWSDWYKVSRHPEREIVRTFVVSSGPLGIIGAEIDIQGTPRLIQVIRRNNEWYVASSLRDQG